jgi:hypothetical protein
MKSTAALSLSLAALLVGCAGASTGSTELTPPPISTMASLAPAPTMPAPPTLPPAETTPTAAVAVAEPTLGQPVPSPALDTFKLLARPFPEGPGAFTGQSYPYRLYTHCGVDFIAFSGRWWRAEQALSDGQGGPPASWGNPFQEGTMLVEAPDKAVFTGDNGETVRFGLTEDDPPPCQ